MTIANDYARQAELALAAYADLANGPTEVLALVDAGMSDAQAQHFAESWRVIAQYNHMSEPYPVYDEFGQLTGYSTTSNGLSATVFEDISTQRRYLAIRGTDDLYDVATDLVSIAILGTTKFLGQYQSLRSKVQEWLADRTLPGPFTVSGHSLGGFLAIGLAADFAANVEHAFTFNTPGIDGLAATRVGADILKAFHINGTRVDPTKIANIRAGEGISLIAGLGLPVSPPVSISIENQFLSDVADPPLSRNHSQRVVADALAIQSAYRTLAPALSTSEANLLLTTSSNHNNQTLESSLDVLRAMLVGPASLSGGATPTEDREALYQNLQLLQSSASYKALSGHAVLRVMMNSEASSLANFAKTDFGDFIALRYLLPVAIQSAETTLGPVHGETYLRWRQDQSIVDQESRPNYTNEWLADRASMLKWKIQYNVADGQVALRSNRVESSVFEDLAAGTAIKLVVGGRQPASLLDPIKVTFGSDLSEWLFGGDAQVGDHLYGMSGADTISGNGGNDYLEGNADGDTLNGNDGNDTLLGGEARFSW